MKLLVKLAALVAISVCASAAVLSVPNDNSHYVEGVSRFIWMPDGEGGMHLVDLEETVNESEVNNFNGNRNEYWLFTRQNQNSRQLLSINNINSVRNSNYRANRGLVVIVHGWRSTGSSSWIPPLTAAFLAVQDVNVIVVDWSVVARRGYRFAKRVVPGVGQHLGDFLNWLINNAGGNWNNVHLIGHSLGAHVVGNAGRRVGGRASRVTGLDPAGPQWGRDRDRLQSNSGRYVEAIHTDGNALGIFDRSGDSDFYPNGGRHAQPGCRSGVTAINCSHSRAYELFTSSVRQHNRFNGRRCNDLNQARNNQCSGATLVMGNALFNKNGNGIYAMTTGSSWPF